MQVLTLFLIFDTGSCVFINPLFTKVLYDENLQLRVRKIIFKGQRITEILSNLTVKIFAINLRQIEL